MHVGVVRVVVDIASFQLCQKLADSPRFEPKLIEEVEDLQSLPYGELQWPVLRQLGKAKHVKSIPLPDAVKDLFHLILNPCVNLARKLSFLLCASVVIKDGRSFVASGSLRNSLDGTNGLASRPKFHRLSASLLSTSKVCIEPVLDRIYCNLRIVPSETLLIPLFIQEATRYGLQGPFMLDNMEKKLQLMGLLELPKVSRGVVQVLKFSKRFIGQ
mmetsp:Transcript_26122/g.60310  ORF Transcript_26122/g.60310 Transcript_26122/m.60310 type:complete len:215 (-) Transcript_26122:327-971(-)